MPSFDSPLLTLGALFVAGQDSRGRQFTGGESGKGLLAGGFAAGSAQFVVDEARSAAGLEEDAISDELAQALLGAGVARFGGPVPQNNAMARGIMYSVAEQGFTKGGFTLGEMIGDIGGGNGNASVARPSGGNKAVQTTPTRSNNDAMVF